MLAYLFIVLVIFIRIFSLPVSFAPAGAALLFFGAYGSRRQWWVPVVMLAGADVYLTLGHYHYPLGWDQLLTWAWYAGAVLLGGVLRDKVRPGRVFGATVAAAVTFFLLSNFAVWAATAMYPHSLSGLMMSYTAALPYFRNDLISNMAFAAVFFSIPALMAARQAQAAKVAK